MRSYTLRRVAAGATALAAAMTAMAVLALAASASPDVRPLHCQVRAPGAITVNAWPPAKRRLAPQGVVVAMRVCRYSGVGSAAPFKLMLSALVASDVQRHALVQALDNLPRPSPIAVCPNDDGTQMLLLLAYRDGHRVTVSVGISGCELATNGDVARTAIRSGLVAQLERL